MRSTEPISRPDDYADVTSAIIHEVNAALPAVEFDFRMEFIDRAATRIDLIVFEAGQPTRTECPVTFESQRAIVNRRRELAERGHPMWKSMTISLRSGQPPIVKFANSPSAA